MGVSLNRDRCVYLNPRAFKPNAHYGKSEEKFYEINH